MKFKLKRMVCTFYAFAMVFLAYGQEKTLYLDSCENFVTADQYAIRRVITAVPGNKFVFTFADYYKDGSEFTSGVTKSRNGKTRDGKYVFHHSSGQRLAHGEYVKGLRSGTWIYFDEKGQEVRRKSMVEKLPVVKFIVDSVEYKGRCLCYTREGPWSEKNLKTNTVILRYYDDGTIIAENGIYLVVDDSATYSLGMDAFYHQINRKLTYPFKTRLASREGEVFVKFAIDEHGEVVDIKFLRELDEPTSRTIEDAIMSTSGNWIPATYRGRKVSSWLVLPVIFKFK